MQFKGGRASSGLWLKEFIRSQQGRTGGWLDTSHSRSRNGELEMGLGHKGSTCLANGPTIWGHSIQTRKLMGIISHLNHSTV